MAKPSVPHFNLPFRFAVHADAVQQSTIDDVTNCVEACLRTHLGWREEEPQFGIDDPVFGQQPINLQPMLSQLLLNEPRAVVLMTQAPDMLDEMIDRILTRVSLRGNL